MTDLAELPHTVPTFGAGQSTPADLVLDELGWNGSGAPGTVRHRRTVGDRVLASEPERGPDGALARFSRPPE